MFRRKKQRQVVSRRGVSKSTPERRPFEMSRRRFLGGAGATLFLPFLEALNPARALAQGAGASPTRLLYYYVPNGIHMPAWTPTETGSDYTLPYILEPLADFQDDLLVLTGLSNLSAIPGGAGDHARGTGCFLTCTELYKTEGANIANGISVDQVAANAIGDQTQLPSLQLGIEGGANLGGCDSGYSCAYARNISWAGPQTPLPKLVYPRLVFDRFFGGFDPSATQEQIELRRRRRTSVLDYVLGEANSLYNQLGTGDQARLEEYLDGVRELERQIEQSGDNMCAQSEYPPQEFDLHEQIDLMTELMVLAFRCDLTRVTTFMMSNASSGRNYEFLGVSGGHHDLSHHQNDPDNFAKLEVIDRWEVEQFAKLVQRLSEVDEGDGTLLDNSLVMFSSEIEDGNSHSHRNLPVLLAGHGGGAVTSGRHIRYENEEPIADLFVSMLDSAGVQVDSFGADGTGPLNGLT